MKRFSALLLLGLALLAQPVFAQNPAMSLMGVVQSDGRSPLSGAAITVIHLPSGVRHAAASDVTGRFVVPNLMAGGPYTVRVGEGGYRPQTVENIFLESGKTTYFTVTLDKTGTGKGKAGAANPSKGSILASSGDANAGRPGLMASSSGSAAAPSTPPPLPPTPATATSTAGAGAGTGAAPGTAAPTPAGAVRPYRRYSYNTGATRSSDPVVPGHVDAKSGNYIYDTGATTTLKLNNGGSVTGVGVNSTESFLYGFLTNPQAQVDTVDLTRGWYNFDRVFFEANKAALTPESVSQLRNVATILRAFPQARIKLGGYTDSTGTYLVNSLLSEARARTALSSLVEMGISPDRIEARGYGPRYSIASNATEEGRARNRRLSVKVLKK